MGSQAAVAALARGHGKSTRQGRGVGCRTGHEHTPILLGAYSQRCRLSRLQVENRPFFKTVSTAQPLPDDQFAERLNIEAPDYTTGDLAP